jgi:hypothetical protein
VPAASAIDAAAAFAQLPGGLREPLLVSFKEIAVNFRERRWAASELDGGKLCEVVYTILKGHVDGTFPARPSKPSNMVQACADLAKADSTRFPRSVRIQIPRMLTALYEVRNNRGVGHVGGDVDPNHMDATVVLAMAQWILAELVRLFHGTDTRTATETVDALVERTLPIVWEVEGKRRVLDPSLKMKQKMMLILYSLPGAVAEATLIDWLEHSNPSVFRRDILLPAHNGRLIEYNQTARTVRLSPLGAREVERTLPMHVQV